MELVKRESIPQVPALSDEKRELTGIQARLSDLSLNRLERHARKEKRKILNETELELFRTRYSEYNRVYKILIAEAEAIITKQAEENVQRHIELSDARIGNNKIYAMKEAAENFTSFQAEISADMPDAVKELLVKRAAAVLDHTWNKIESCEFSIQKALTENYPDKKGSSWFKR